MTKISERQYSVERQPEGYYSAAPLPTAEELRVFYAEVYYQDLPSATYQASYNEEEQAHIDLRTHQLLHALAEAGLRGEGHSLLEIGVGEGFFLKHAQNAGFAVMGIDFSAHGVEQFNPDIAPLIRTGDAYDLLDEMIAGEERCDVIVLQNVLEHVIEPIRLLRGISELLQPGGVAVIKVPNDYSRLQKAALERGLIDRPFWFGPPQHLHYFTADSLRVVCEAQGLAVCDLFADFPVDWFLFHTSSNYIADPAQGKSAHRARVILDLLMAEAGVPQYHEFCRALAGVGMGRNVAAIVRKPVG